LIGVQVNCSRSHLSPLPRQHRENGTVIRLQSDDTRPQAPHIEVLRRRTLTQLCLAVTELVAAPPRALRELASQARAVHRESRERVPRVLEPSATHQVDASIENRSCLASMTIASGEFTSTRCSMPRRPLRPGLNGSSQTVRRPFKQSSIIRTRWPARRSSASTTPGHRASSGSLVGYWE
jgi:hypothetical protein